MKKIFLFYVSIILILSMSKTPEKPNSSKLIKEYNINKNDIKFIEENIELISDLNLYENLEIFTNTSKGEKK